MHRFYKGDEVIYLPRGCTAKVLGSEPNDEYLVEWDDKTLIPPQMKVPGQHLKPKFIPGIFGDFADLDFEDSYYDSKKDVQCPRCGTPWTETWIGHRPFYDCLRCKIKKEDA